MIRGTTRRVDNTIDINLDIHNRFDIEVIDIRTGRTKRRAKAYNCICTKLWEKLFANSAYFQYIQYGGGSGSPAPSDTKLFSLINAMSAGQAIVNCDWDSGVYSCRRSIQIPSSMSNGKVITEVGIAYDTVDGALCTHAMLVDMNGNPISIEKTDTDVINIYATVFVHFAPEGYDDGCIHLFTSTVQSSAHFFNWACGIGSYGGNRVLVSDAAGFYRSTYQFTAGGNYSELTSTNKFDVEARTMTISAPRLESSNGNFSHGILMVYSGYYSSFSYAYRNVFVAVAPGGKWFPYSTVTAEAVGTGDGETTDYALKFAYPYDAVIYVDGVESDNVSVDYAVPTDKEWARYLVPLRVGSTVDKHMIVDYPYTGGPVAYSSVIYYNPMHAIGISKITIGTSTAKSLQVSDDLVNWDDVNVTLTSGSKTIPNEHVHKKYWKAVTGDKSAPFITGVTPYGNYVGKNLHFTEPPPEGAVITADYKCDCIAKDADHVFDFSLVFHLGEYNEG